MLRQIVENGETDGGKENERERESRKREKGGK